MLLLLMLLLKSLDLVVPQAIVILPTGGGMQLLLCYDSKLPSALSVC